MLRDELLTLVFGLPGQVYLSSQDPWSVAQDSFLQGLERRRSSAKNKFKWCHTTHGELIVSGPHADFDQPEVVNSSQHGIVIDRLYEEQKLPLEKPDC